MSFVNDAISVIEQNARLRKGPGRRFTTPKTRFSGGSPGNKIKLDQASTKRILASKAKQSKREVVFIVMYGVLAFITLCIVLSLLI